MIEPATAPRGPDTRDYFAEMYVAGVLADAGWDIYFPRRDKGFDMIVSRPISGGTSVRPVQVKGKYATETKTDKATYGFAGALTAYHPDMILAIPFFTSVDAKAPRLIAWVPGAALKMRERGDFRFEPATYKGGEPLMRRDHVHFFGDLGLQALVRSEPSE